jgi:TolB-like protein
MAASAFVSYASRDTAVANSIVENLERHGHRCWMAPRDVKPGAQYADAIVGAINEAEAVVVVLSQSAIASSHVAREVERSASKRKPIIAFRIDAAALNRELEYFLSNSQWIDAVKLGMPSALVKLSEAVSQEAAAQEAGNASDPIGPTKPAERTSARSKLIAAAAAVIAVGAAIALGVYLWTSKPGSAQAPAIVAPGARERAASPLSDKSIAVLPFTDMSENKDQEYFADGMAEEVLDLLTKVPGIRVIGRTSSFQFKGKSADLRSISQTLGAIYVIEGSVRKSGDRLRVTAQLIGAADGSHLWSQTYDEKSGDVLGIQDRIAAGIVRALQVTVGADGLQDRPALKSADAYDLYLRGRHEMDRFDKTGF